MADQIVLQADARTNCVALTDQEGRMWFLPSPTAEFFIGRGIKSIPNLTLTFVGEDGTSWLRLREAASKHLDDVDGMTLHAAEVKIARACDAGKITATGRGTARRIEPVSFDAWRLAERERNLSQD